MGKRVVIKSVSGNLILAITPQVDGNAIVAIRVLDGSEPEGRLKAAIEVNKGDLIWAAKGE